MSSTFEMAPPKRKLFYIYHFGLLALMGTLLVFTVYFVLAERSVSLDAQSLRVDGTFYGHEVPRDQLLVDGVRELNLDEDSELELDLKTNGIWFFGYAEGWFELENGQSAFVLATDPSAAVYIPTAKGHAVVVSPSDRAAFIAELKQR